MGVYSECVQVCVWGVVSVVCADGCGGGSGEGMWVVWLCGCMHVCGWVWARVGHRGGGGDECGVCVWV